MSSRYIVESGTNIVYNLELCDDVNTSVEDGFYAVPVDGVEILHDTVLHGINYKVSYLKDDSEDAENYLCEIVEVSGNYFLQSATAPYESWTKNADGIWTAPTPRPTQSDTPVNGIITRYEWGIAENDWVAIEEIVEE